MLASLRTLIRRSFRYRLLLLVLLPLAVAVPSLLGLSVWWAWDFVYQQLFLKVNTDLSVADDVFRRQQKDYLARLEALAGSYALRTALAREDQQRVVDQLEAVRLTVPFDFLHLRALDAARAATERDPSPLLRNAVRRRQAGVGVEVFTPERLAEAGESLVQRVILPLLPTPRAVDTDRKVEDRAMVVRAVCPVRDEQGQVTAVLDGGVLLNGNFNFVDAIRDLVYGPGSVPAGGWGTVTVFLDDVRVSTNVPLTAGDRALGTRVSREVREKVLEQGETWIDRAFVVNDWYISAYEPIIDVQGERVGMLYAGFLESPYREAFLAAISLLIIGLLIATTVIVLLVIRGANTLVGPIERITQVVRATQEGEERRIGAVRSEDELGELARQFDRMLDLLRRRSQEIQRAAEVLELKVEDRTAELRRKNESLQRTIDLLRQTRRQLVMAEKLAALGELTAGVAHEINNPTGVILGNMDVIVRELEENADPVRTEIDLIIEQVYRIRSIVERLLQYARPGDYSAFIEAVDVSRIVEDTLALVKHEIQSRRVAVTTDFHARLRVGINPQELQQVLVNLLVNACHSLEKGGEIRVTTRDWQDIGAVISVWDNGPGIPPDHQGRIFDPFFTTKGNQGTGLGLSVSYGLIRRYGGTIALQSNPGEGTTFEVFLRTEPRFTNDDESVLMDADVVER